VSVPYWQAREWAVQADVGVDTMRAVLAGADATKSRARARAYHWLKDHGRLAFVPNADSAHRERQDRPS
jgi:hypothetical protein